ncbi:MAG: type II toxin-antitoxin system RelE/ParE family toxin [Oscillospiraceae bacterium]|nr:type II toxin-antitoxin system RelE/ParE family toxin [Oscillospiraceae bacterium]
MKYTVAFSKRARKELGNLDKYTQKLIVNWIEKNLEGCSDPHTHGKALTGDLKGIWRYRIGDYRLLCDINDNELIILALSIGHRREVYR